MTVITGIVCKAGIVLACDSQTTYGYAKRCDAEKIRIVEFRNRKVLVAQAGAVATSSRVIDIMEQMARGCPIENGETVVRTTLAALLKGRQELREQHFSCSSEELATVIDRHGLDSDLMVAYFSDGKPFIHTFNFMAGVLVTSKSRYESTGCGAPMANYLLSELVVPDMDTRHAKAVSVYVIDKVIKHVAYCDRPIRLAVIHSWEPHTITMPGGLPLYSEQPEQSSTIFLDNVDIVPLKDVESITTRVTAIDVFKRDRKSLR